MNEDDKDSVYNSLGLPSLTRERTIEVTSPNRSKQDEIEDDLDEIRSNVKTLAEKGEVVLDELQSISISSQDPKLVREFTVLLKTMLDANKELTDIVRVRKEYVQEKVDADKPQPNHIHNNLILTTSDMVKKLKDEE